jgi:(p)ppGpp synthase/HD superfamily hydrolase
MILYERALRIATQAHKDQVRKQDGSPYIVHPMMVAKILSDHGFSAEVVAAGLVHDVLEDTVVTEDELRAELGDEVTDIVTAVSEDKDLPWEKRKEQYVEAVVSAGEAVWAVSVADKIHNAESLSMHYQKVGSAVWQVFNRGKEKKVWFERLLLTKLREVWHHPLLDEYGRLVEELESLEG